MSSWSLARPELRMSRVRLRTLTNRSYRRLSTLARAGAGVADRLNSAGCSGANVMSCHVGSCDGEDLACCLAIAVRTGVSA